jgi:hypothetical protein
MTATTTQTGPCTTCGGPTQADVRDGCTSHTCTTPCAACGHAGDVHRDWYQKQHGAGFCRRCHPEQRGYRHDYQPADRATEK